MVIQNRNGRRVAAGLLSLGLVLAPVQSAFAVSPADAQQADALFQTGREFMDAKRLPEACAAFHESNRLDPALGTLLNLADCEERVGRSALAYRYFQEAETWAKREKQKKREVVARKRVAVLAERISWLRIEIPADTEVEVDGEAVPAKERQANYAITAAMPHTVMVLAPGKAPSKIAVPITKTGEVTDIRVPGEDVPAVALSSGSQGLWPSDSSMGGSADSSLSTTMWGRNPRQKKIVGFTMAGVGAAALGVGIYGLVHSFKTAAAVKRQQPGGADFGSPTVSRDSYERLGTVYPLSWASAAVGAGLMGAGLYLALPEGSQGAPQPFGLSVGGKL